MLITSDNKPVPNTIVPDHLHLQVSERISERMLRIEPGIFILCTGPIQGATQTATSNTIIAK